MTKHSLPKPIVKWAGGKGQLLEDLWLNRPQSFNTYYEPFLGGGAFFYELFRRGVLANAVLSDANHELISLYLTVRDNVDDLIEELGRNRYVNEKEAYYHIRSEEPKDSILRAARFIYLNRTCYNGLYRVNSAGKFNVPFGRYKNPRILDEENLRAVSEAFKSARITAEDFEKVVSAAKRGDFIYFDPPYAPLSETADFTAYTKAGFSFDEQIRLARVFSKLSERGCYVLESNSATSAIRELYGDYTIVEVYAARAISSDVSTRGKIPEFIIRNYEPAQVQSRLDEF